MTQSLGLRLATFIQHHHSPGNGVQPPRPALYNLLKTETPWNPSLCQLRCGHPSRTGTQWVRNRFSFARIVMYILGWGSPTPTLAGQGDSQGHAVLRSIVTHSVMLLLTCPKEAAGPESRKHKSRGLCCGYDPGTTWESFPGGAVIGEAWGMGIWQGNASTVKTRGCAWTQPSLL